MPILGFGVYQIPPEETERAVTRRARRRLPAARHRRRLRQRGGRRPGHQSSGIPREELFVTTKLWVQDARPRRTPGAPSTTSLEQARPRPPRPVPDPPALRRRLRPVARHGGRSTARAAPGRSASSNFYPDRLVDLIVNNEITPAVNQIETHPFFQRADRPGPHARARRADRVLGRRSPRAGTTCSPTRC